MTFYAQKFWNGIFSLSEDITLTKIDYKRGEAGLTRLPGGEGKEEVKNNPLVYTTQEGVEQIKDNPQVYTTQEGIEEIENNPQVYTTQKGIERNLKKKPSGIHYPREYNID